MKTLSGLTVLRAREQAGDAGLRHAAARASITLEQTVEVLWAGIRVQTE